MQGGGGALWHKGWWGDHIIQPVSMPCALSYVLFLLVRVFGLSANLFRPNRDNAVVLGTALEKFIRGVYNTELPPTVAMEDITEAGYIIYLIQLRCQPFRDC